MNFFFPSGREFRPEVEVPYLKLMGYFIDYPQPHFEWIIIRYGNHKLIIIAIG